MSATVEGYRAPDGSAWAVVRYETATQTFEVRVPEEDAETVARALPLCAYGADFRRNVRDAMDTYYSLTQRGERCRELALRWLELASALTEKAEGEVHP